MKLIWGLSFVILTSLIGCSDGVSKVAFRYVGETDNGNIVAKAGKLQITRDELLKGIQLEIYNKQEEIFELKKQALKNVIVEKLVKQETDTEDVQAYLKKNVYKDKKVTDKEAIEYAKANNIPETAVDERLKGEIRRVLSYERMNEELDQWMAKKLGKTEVKVYFQGPKPLEVTAENAPVKGAEDAPVTIVEFSDFQCGHCSKGAEIVSDVQKKYGKKVKLAHRNFPLDGHPQAKKASLAALCVYEQDEKKFWSYHHSLFSDQANLGDPQLIAKAGKLGIDKEKFEKCFQSQKYLSKVEKDIALGDDLGVRSTPTYLVNGRPVMGARSAKYFSDLIDKELEEN